jgi:hypothetical protein
MSPLKRTMRGRDGLPTCPICNEPVNLEISVTDDHGRAIHEECYIKTVIVPPADAGSIPRRAKSAGRRTLHKRSRA